MNKPQSFYKKKFKAQPSANQVTATAFYLQEHLFIKLFEHLGCFRDKDLIRRPLNCVLMEA
jgi:hypothetical protein